MCRILLADSDPSFRWQIRRSLSQEKMNAVILDEATCAQEAAKRIRHMLPDLLITDIAQPETDGFGLIEMLRAVGGGIGCVPHIVIASHASDAANMRRAIRCGVSDYLVKPVSYVELSVLLKTHLGNGIGRDSAATNPVLVSVIRRTIMENSGHIFKVQELAAQLQITPNYLSYLFKKKTGMTLILYQNQIKMAQARKLLFDEPQMKIYEIAAKLGFADEKYFSRVFTRIHHMTPSEYRSSCLAQAGVNSAFIL